MPLRSPAVACARGLTASPVAADAPGPCHAASRGPSTGRATPQRPPVAPGRWPAGPGARMQRAPGGWWARGAWLPGARGRLARW